MRYDQAPLDQGGRDASKAVKQVVDVDWLRALASAGGLVNHICDPLVDVELQAGIPGMKVRCQL